MIPRILLSSLLIALCGCEAITTIPVSAVTDPPTIVFFNSNYSGNKVRFTGTASDPNGVKQVEVSFDGGTNWETTLATLQALGGGEYLWHFDAVAADVPASFTIVSRATNNGNMVETPGAGSAGTEVASSVPSSLTALVSASYASTAIIYLSSGSGGAYLGTPSSPLLLGNTDPMVIVGMGAGAGGTILEAPSSAACLFSVGADISLRGLRLRGAKVGARTSPAAGGALSMEAAGCYFASQARWGIQAAGRAAPAASLAVALSECTFDSRGGASDNGGANLRYGTVNAFDCTFRKAIDPSEGGEASALYLEAPGAASRVDSCIFTDNAYPLKCSSGSPVISSCRFLPGGYSLSNGIILRGSSGSPVLRRNRIESNDGFGVLVRDGMTPILYKNRIAGNGRAGVIVDGAGARPNLGNGLGGGSPPTDGSGYNDIYSNACGTNPDGISPSQIVNLYVTADTPFSADYIKALWNYWGPGITTQGQVEGVIIDYTDYPLRAKVNSVDFKTIPLSGL